MRLSSIKNIITVQIIFLLFILLTGCSSNSSNPVTGDITHQDNLQIAPTESNEISSLGIMGAYNLTLSPDGSNAELVSIRSSDLGESYIVSGAAFFTQSPCTDCLNLRSLSLDDGFIKLTFKVSHPFEKGDPLKPPSALNRLDLDVLDMAMVVVPSESIADTYTLTGTDIYTEICGKADGYTRELAQVIGDDAALPYFLVIDDNESGIKTDNIFEMGTKDVEFDTWFKGGQFNLFLTMGYGASAKKPERLTPTYYIPEFNRKAAWKVIVTPPDPSDTWVEGDTSTEHEVTIDIYDWNHGVSIATDYPDPANTDHIYASSDISAVSVEIPGMTEAIVNATTTDTVTDGYSDPITYTASFANENSLSEGTYTGLVKVTDTRPPGVSSAGGETDTLVHSPDGIALNWFNIPEYAVYQTFEATVAEGEGDGSLIWAKRAGGVGRDDSYAITSLSDNSTVVTGRFSGTATFGEGESNQTILTSVGACDILIACYNSDGLLVWAKRAGGPGFDSTSDDYGLAITALTDNSTVVTGRFFGSAIFGEGETNETALSSGMGSDVFIARYNSDGTLQWAKGVNGNHWDVGSGITALSDNSIVVTGVFQSSNITFGAGEPNETIMSTAGGTDVFIARYNPNGTLAWAKQAGGSGHDDGTAITTLSDDSTILTGYFNVLATFGLGESNETTLSADGDRDIFIARFNENGTLAWAKRAGGTDLDTAYEITTLSDNSIVETGIFSGTAIFGQGEPNQTQLVSSGGYDIFIARYNSDGMLAWAKRAGGIGTDCGNGIASLPDDSIIITGAFENAAIFGPGESNETILTSAGDLDIFVADYNPDGTLTRVKQAGGTDLDNGYEIAALSDNSTVVSGLFNLTATFGPGEPNQIFLTSDGGNDIFIARFAP